ncbi:hypothetical protein [Hoeflea alexandrii]
MSDHDRTSQSRFARFCGPGDLLPLAARAAGRLVAYLLSCRRVMAADELDERLKRDIGFTDRGVPQDRRTAHYRKLLERGQPLP